MKMYFRVSRIKTFDPNLQLQHFTTKRKRNWSHDPKKAFMFPTREAAERIAFRPENYINGNRPYVVQEWRNK